MVSGILLLATLSMRTGGPSQGGLLMWQDEAKCLNQDVSIFFEIYEDNPKTRKTIDAVCSECPVQKRCFEQGVSNKEWGVWGSVFLENGEISKEFNSHKTNDYWETLWMKFTHQQPTR